MTDRAARKAMIAERLMALESEELETAKAHYAAYLKDSRLSGGESHDTSDFAEARESADLAAAFDHPVQAHHAKIDVLENTDFGLKEMVEPGAVVSFGDRHFIVSVSTIKFEVDGETYMGISTSSPIYRAMAGLTEGDEFTHNGQTITLDEVF